MLYLDRGNELVEGVQIGKITLSLFLPVLSGAGRAGFEFET